ncbi:unnamed protein product, partial [Ectocarpus sp. 13 AM-2016]
SGSIVPHVPAHNQATATQQQPRGLRCGTQGDARPAQRVVAQIPHALGPRPGERTRRRWRSVCAASAPAAWQAGAGSSKSGSVTGP